MNNEEKRCSGCGVLLQDQNLLQDIRQVLKMMFVKDALE